MKYYLEEGRAKGSSKVKYFFQECQQLEFWNNRHGAAKGKEEKKKQTTAQQNSALCDISQKGIFFCLKDYLNRHNE